MSATVASLDVDAQVRPHPVMAESSHCRRGRRHAGDRARGVAQAVRG